MDRLDWSIVIDMGSANERIRVRRFLNNERLAAIRVKRHIWLIATVAALFVLQAPFCALACFEPAEADPSAIAESSCHETSPDSSPAGESNSHADCDCQFTTQALVSQPMDSNTTTTVEFVVHRTERIELIDSRRSQVPRVEQNADLPPPDILLQKSTLII
jgi:hypothetical protein